MITSNDIETVLREVGATDRPLMVHADLRACLRVEGSTSEEKLRAVVVALRRASGPFPLLMPTFTYSYCQGEPYDPERSPSATGALSERFRKEPGVRRTLDPLFSVAVEGELGPRWDHLFQVRDVNCFGADSVFGYLLQADAAVVFFGVGMEACTLVHHLEQRRRVSYRHVKDFHGTTILGEARIPTRASFFVRPLDGSADVDFWRLERDMLAKGEARKAILQDGPEVTAAGAQAIARAVDRGLRTDPRFLLAPAAPRSRQG